jgi:hypothetical protein
MSPKKATQKSDERIVTKKGSSGFALVKKAVSV